MHGSLGPSATPMKVSQPKRNAEPSLWPGRRHKQNFPSGLGRWVWHWEWPKPLDLIGRGLSARSNRHSSDQCPAPHAGWSRRRTAQGGEGVWWVGFLTISKYFIKCISFKHIKYFAKSTWIKGGSLKVRSADNIYVSFVWWMDLGNQNYPSGETREWWNLGTLKPNKWRVPQLEKNTFMPIKLMGFLPMKIAWFWIYNLNGPGVSFDDMGTTYVWLINGVFVFLQTDLFRLPLWAAQPTP